MEEKDTIAILNVVDKFFGYLKEGRPTDAAGMLYMKHPQKPYDEPELLDNEQLQKAIATLKSIPVTDYKVDYIKIHESYENEVKCTVTMFKGNGNDKPDAKTVFYLRPVSYLGNWVLCLMDTNSGSNTIVNSKDRDSVATNYTLKQRHKLKSKQ
ncbi:MAG: hypothetical protein PUD52_11190 [Prevotella sp.]|nr:hypothetical protein [Prevotella sp.]